MIKYISAAIAAIFLYCGAALSQDYKSPLPGDPAPIHAPAYEYGAVVTGIYDSDTMRMDIDLGFEFWRKDVEVRLAGVNAYEIKRNSRKTFLGLPIDAAHVKLGFQCRDMMIEWLGGAPSLYPRKVKYHDLVTTENMADVPEAWLEARGPPVIVQTLADESGKFGRPLVILWVNGKNLNQWLARSGCASVNWYDGNEYKSTSPIIPKD